jgi:hypothetical protein
MNFDFIDLIENHIPLEYEITKRGNFIHGADSSEKKHMENMANSCNRLNDILLTGQTFMQEIICAALVDNEYKLDRSDSMFLAEYNNAILQLIAAFDSVGKSAKNISQK